MNFAVNVDEVENAVSMVGGAATHPMKLGSQSWTLITSPVFTGVVYFPGRHRRENRWRVTAMWRVNLPCFGIIDADDAMFLFYNNEYCKRVEKGMVTDENQIGAWLLSQLNMAALIPQQKWEPVTDKMIQEIKNARRYGGDGKSGRGNPENPQYLRRRSGVQKGEEESVGSEVEGVDSVGQTAKGGIDEGRIEGVSSDEFSSGGPDDWF